MKNKYKFILGLCILAASALFTSSTFAEKVPTIIWQKISDNEQYFSAIETSDNSIVAAGEKNSSTAIIVKYDASGNVIWEKEWSGTYTDYKYNYFSSVAEAPDGNYIAAGVTVNGWSGITWDYDGLLVKFDKSTGNVIWQKTWGGNNGGDFFRCAAVALDGSIYAVGYSYSTNISGITNKGYDDGILVKFNQSGSVVWKKNWGTTENDDFVKVILGSDESIIVGARSGTNDDAILIKYDKNGNLLSQKNYSVSGRTSLDSITEMTDGSVVVVGSADGAYNPYVMKVGQSGEKLWHQTLGKNNSNQQWYDSAAETTDGSIVVAGYSANTDTPGFTNHGGQDGILAKYDQSGNSIWKYGWGGSNEDLFLSVVKTSDGGMLIAAKTCSSDIEGLSNESGCHAALVKIMELSNGASTVNVEIGTAISIEVPDTIDLAVAPGSFNSTAANIKVGSNSQNGFTTSIATESESSDLKHITAAATIPTLTSAVAKTGFTEGSWGISFDNVTYNPVRSPDEAQTPIEALSSNTNTAIDSDIYIGAKPSIDQLSGIYRNTLIVTVIPNL